MEYSPAAWERAMRRQDVILRAMSGELSWFAAADILQMTPRNLRRWRERYERWKALPQDERASRRDPVHIKPGADAELGELEVRHAHPPFDGRVSPAFRDRRADFLGSILSGTAEALDSLGPFLERYVGRCKDPDARFDCERNVRAVRQGLDGRAYATSVAEAAGIDLALVLDRSNSMSNDTPAPESTDATMCGPRRTCIPFEDVRQQFLRQQWYLGERRRVRQPNRPAHARMRRHGVAFRQ